VTIRAHVLVGTTGSGKSAVAQWLAERAEPRREVWSADSMAVYRGMDVGTAKVGVAERGTVTYRGMDLAAPDCAFSAGEWLAALKAEVARAGGEAAVGVPIVAGGTGLYVKALAEGLDAAVAGSAERRAEAERILAERGREGLAEAARALNPAEFAKVRDPENPRRLVRAYELFAAGQGWPGGGEGGRELPRVAGIRRGAEDLRERLERRVRWMFSEGLVDEVRELRRRWPALSETARHAIGYEEAGKVADGEMGVEEAIARTAARTRQYAKRQMTWFRHQLRVEWVDAAPGESVESLAARVAAAWERTGTVELRGMEER
jgi:tRNA dimethylallyltransferase